MARALLGFFVGCVYAMEKVAKRQGGTEQNCPKSFFIKELWETRKIFLVAKRRRPGTRRAGREPPNHRRCIRRRWPRPTNRRRSRRRVAPESGRTPGLAADRCDRVDRAGPVSRLR